MPSDFILDSVELPQKDFDELPDLFTEEGSMSQKYYYVTITPGELCKIQEQEKTPVLELETLQKAVGGYIEALYVNVEGTPIVLWVDEEGTFKQGAKGCIETEHGFIVGSVCITGQDGPETIGVSKAFAEKIKEHFDRFVLDLYPNAK